MVSAKICCHVAVKQLLFVFSLPPPNDIYQGWLGISPSISVLLIRGAVGGQSGLGSRNKKKWVFNKLTIQVCVSCSWHRDGFPGLLRLVQHTWRCPFFSEVPKATHEASQWLLKGTLSAQKVLKGPRQRRGSFWEELKIKDLLWREVIDLPYKQINDFLAFCAPSY